MPAMTKDAITRIVMTGRRMQRAESISGIRLYLAARWRRRGRRFRCARPYADIGAVDQAKLAVDDHQLSVRQAPADHRFAVLRALDDHVAQVGHAILDDEQVGTLRPELDGGRGNGDRIGLDAEN